jgi:REP element-mobilizing transposase RayT
VRLALNAGKEHFGFALVEFSVQHDHLHLIAEARDRRALSRRLQGLSIRVARAVNRRLERAGKLFAGRYHARVLKTPRAVRFALRHVLLNVRRHAPAKQRKSLLFTDHSTVPVGFVDRCSTAPWFAGFARPSELAFGARVARAEWTRTSGSLDPPIMPAHSWLLRAGQQRAGPFDVDVFRMSLMPSVDESNAASSRACSWSRVAPGDKGAHTSVVRGRPRDEPSFPAVERWQHGSRGLGPARFHSAPGLPTDVERADAV